MIFQFVCPHGHLLQCEESHTGQQCHCPHCGVLFIIPAPPIAQSVTIAPTNGPIPPPSELFANEPTSEPVEESAPVIEAEPTGIDVCGPKIPDLVHVLCPLGHELETPQDMLGQEAICPHCQTQFLLRFEDSIEYKERRVKEENYRFQRLGRTWLNRAIVAAVLVVLGIVGMIAIHMLK